MDKLNFDRPKHTMFHGKGTEKEEKFQMHPARNVKISAYKCRILK